MLEDKSVHVPLQHAGCIPRHGNAMHEPQWFTLEERSVQFPEQHADAVGGHYKIY